MENEDPKEEAGGEEDQAPGDATPPRRQKSKPPPGAKIVEDLEASDVARAAELAALIAKSDAFTMGRGALDVIAADAKRAVAAMQYQPVPVFTPPIDRSKRDAEYAAVETSQKVGEHVGLAAQQLQVLEEVREISTRMEASSTVMEGIARKTLVIAGLTFGIAFLQLWSMWTATPAAVVTPPSGSSTPSPIPSATPTPPAP